MKLYTFHLNDGSSVVTRGVYTYDEDNFYVTAPRSQRWIFPRDRVLYWVEDFQR